MRAWIPGILLLPLYVAGCGDDAPATGDTETSTSGTDSSTTAGVTTAPQTSGTTGSSSGSTSGESTGAATEADGSGSSEGSSGSTTGEPPVIPFEPGALLLDSGGFDSIYDTVTLESGSTVAVGSSSGQDTSRDVWVASIAVDGTIDWSVQLVGPGWDVANAVVALPDRIRVLGRSDSFVPLTNDGLLIDLDFDGTVLAQRRLSSTHSLDPRAAVTRGNTTYVAGSALLDGDTDAWLAAFDADGEPLWSQRLGGPGNDDASGLALEGSRLHFAGTTTSFGDGSIDAYVGRVDRASGDVELQLTLGGDAVDRTDAVTVADDGTVYAVGQTRSAGSGGADGLIVELSGDDVSRVWTLGSPANDVLSAIASDGEVVVAGRSLVNNPEDFLDYDLWLTTISGRTLGATWTLDVSGDYQTGRSLELLGGTDLVVGGFSEPEADDTNSDWIFVRMTTGGDAAACSLASPRFAEADAPFEAATAQGIPAALPITVTDEPLTQATGSTTPLTACE